MRYEHDGIAVWYPLNQSSSCEGEIPAAADGRLTGIRLAIGVKPIGSRNTVEIRYRLNGGGIVARHASQTGVDHRSNTQHFLAAFPDCHVGDKIDYAVVLHGPASQIPPESDAKRLPSSFSVVASSTKSQTQNDKDGASASRHAAGTKPSTSDRPAATPNAATTTIPETGKRFTKSQLLQLQRMADQSLSDILKSDASLGKVLADVIAADRKEIVTRAFRRSSTTLQSVLGKIDFSPALPAAATIRSAIEAGLVQQKANNAVKREATQKIVALERSSALDDHADIDTPVVQHPLFQDLFKQAALYLLTDCVKLADAKADRLVALAGSPALVDDAMLASLVAEKTLTDAEAASLGVALSVCMLAGGAADVAVEMKPKIASLADIATVSADEWLQAIDRAKARPPDGLDAAEYAAALRCASANLYPTDALHSLTLPTDPKRLEKALTDIAPLSAKNSEIIGKDFEQLDTSGLSDAGLDAAKSAHRELQAFANQHPGLQLAGIANGRGSTAEKMSQFAARRDVLSKLRALNPDHEFMGLDYTEGSPDLADLKSDGLSPAELHLAISDLKAAQRVHALTRNVDHTSTILAAGYSSASEVAIDDADEFQRKTAFPRALASHYHDKSAAALSRASHAVISAVDASDGPFQRTRAGNARQGIKDHLKAIPGFSELFGSQAYCNCTECQSIIGASAYFVDLMTFIEENLTGRAFRGKKAHDPLNLKVRRPDLWTLPLTCDNTNDLISYLDVINPTLEDYIAGRGLGHDNTHHEPHPAANHDQRLKGPKSQHNAKAKGQKDRRRVGSAERPSAATLVYENTLAKSQASFQQPFVLPLEKLDIYLEHFAVPRVQIARTLGADKAVIIKAALKISDTVFRQLTDINTDQAFLKKVYGIAFAFGGAAGHVDGLNVIELMKATGFSRTDIETAATSRFVTRNGANRVEIRSGKKSAESIQDDIERVYGLNADALHRLYRFARLLRATPWSIAELDLILVQLGATGAASGLDAQVLFRLTQLLDLRARWSLPVDQTCALWSDIPTEPKSGNLFDRLFNFPPLLVTDRTLPVPDAKFVHAAFSRSGEPCVIALSPQGGAASASSVDLRKVTQRILAALQVSDGDLILLITNLANALGINPQAPTETDAGFILSLNNLTLLYRHASLARLLNLSIAQLFQLVRLAGISRQYLATFDDLMSLLDFCDWYQSTGYQLDDLGTITGGPVLNPASYPDQTALAAQLVQTIATEHTLEFSDRVFVTLLGVTEAESQQMIAGNPTLFEAVVGAATPTFRLTPALRPGTALQFSDTVFSFQPGVTEQQSQQIVAANPTLFSAVANAQSPTYQLSPAFGVNSAIVIPDGIGLAPSDATTALIRYSTVPGGVAAAGSGLLNYHPVIVVPALLSGLLATDSATLSAIVGMTGTDLNSADLFAALQAGPSAAPAAIAPLASLIGQVVPLKVMSSASGFGADDLAYVQANAAVFAVTSFNTLSISNVLKLGVYARFVATLASNPPGITPLRDVLTAFSSTTQFNQADPNELATVLGINPKQLASLLPNVTLPLTAPEALSSLAAIVALTARLGVGADALKLMLSDAYADQSLAGDAVLGAFRAQFQGDDQFLETSKPFDDRIRQSKRDALADYLMTWSGYRFDTLDDMYNYFLLDVQLEACMETSWVVAAISSAQLYVYRCLMDLEQDQREPDDPDHIHVVVPASAAEEWEWRKNYRVWQANREVFLNPENYILPELRDDKTPLFEDLESALLQQPINEQNVLDAYSTYMNGFDQLSKLQIAGSYLEIDSNSTTDVLHLFGVTPADPPTFFYRTIENASHGETETDRAVNYTPWVPVNLQIHCRQISPIVYLGRLFVFWTQISTAPQNLVVSANSIFNGYKHTWRVKYSSLRLDQSWTPPQQLAMADTQVFANGDGIIMDPLLDFEDKDYNGNDDHTTALLNALTASNPTDYQQAWMDAYVAWQQKYQDPNYSSDDLTLSSYQGTLVPLYGNSVQTASVDGYTLRGFQWDRVYPTLSDNAGDLLLTGRNFVVRAERADFYNQILVSSGHAPSHGAAQTVLCSKPDKGHSRRSLYSGIQDSFPKLERYPWCSIVAKQEYIQKLPETLESADIYVANMATFEQLGARSLAEQSADMSSGEPLKRGLYGKHIATIDGEPDIAPVNSSQRDAITDTIIDADGDVLLLQGRVRPGRFVMKRLTTTLGENLCRALFVKGVDGLLDLDTQLHFREGSPALKPRDDIDDEVVVGKMDFTGAMGTYFREVFFHVPHLIAHVLNGQSNFEAARTWYQYIFNPAANDDEPTSKHEVEDRHRDDRVDGHHDAEAVGGKRASSRLVKSSAGESVKESRDRVWRFIEFRNLDVPSLRKILTDATAIDAYERDPFNPDAIARLRLSAYQKCIVMNYIDNLLDWGDALFTEFEMETVNEATLLYVEALEVLGPRPGDVGDCGQANENERTYERIAPLVRKGSTFLMEMETYSHTGTGAARAQPKRRPQHQYTIGHAAAVLYFNDAVNACRRRRAEEVNSKPERMHASAMASAGTHESKVHSGRTTEGRDHSTQATAERGSAHPYHWKGMNGSSRSASRGTAQKGYGRKGARRTLGGHESRFAWSVARHVVPVFCVPPNGQLLGYWDRVEDRLYKIRHGMDITGALRQLSLFAPPINPLLLVETTAAGISLDAVTDSNRGDAPPYRFMYLIDKAKQFASQVQSFGGALLSAIEKRDTQQLEVLRVTQQQNILAMTTSTKQAEIDGAQNAIDTLNAQLDTAQFRHDYFQGLVDGGLNAWEGTETTIRAIMTYSALAPVAIHALSGVIHLLPQLGSPFAMKYGGLDIGASIQEFGKSYDAIVKSGDTLAVAAGLVGGWQRRSDSWQHEVDMASKDIAQITTQLAGASIRLSIARTALNIHEKAITQEQQIADFYRTRFSSIALYTWLASTLKTTYRHAYNSAFAMAGLAQQAYQFERNDETAFIGTTYWSQAQGGLLAGDMLLGDLQRMEQRFLETNYRTPEITQSFSVLQIAPAALLDLRQNATCNFTIPELCFDLYYPGHYCRRIKAVRMTIPCVAGPLTNVGATLTLTNSWVRLTSTSSSVTPIQLKHSTMIATSTAQNDSGVFEFSFRDERYMNFEGAGANSSWEVMLPDGFRNFDYQTITDVILTISYTSLYDDALRRSVEQKNGLISKVLQSQPLARLFSLRQEFPSVLNKLLHGALNAASTMTISANMLPYFIATSTIQVTRAALLLRTAGSTGAVEGFAVSIDGTGITGFQSDPSLADLVSADVTAVFSATFVGQHSVMITNAGNLAPAPTQPGDPSPVDDTKLLDVLLYVQYQIGTT